MREHQLSGKLIVAEDVLCVMSFALIEIAWVGACNLRPHLAQLRQLGLRRTLGTPGCRMKYNKNNRYWGLLVFAASCLRFHDDSGVVTSLSYTARWGRPTI